VRANDNPGGDVANQQGQLEGAGEKGAEQAGHNDQNKISGDPHFVIVPRRAPG
jgi:hypothetical protein